MIPVLVVLSNPHLDLDVRIHKKLAYIIAYPKLLQSDPDLVTPDLVTPRFSDTIFPPIFFENFSKF